MRTPTIAPMPPVAAGAGLPWDTAMEDPVGALAQARRSLGDTFVVDSGDDRYLFTFSPVGVRSFYALPEEQASKGVADWRMLRRKLPDEMFDGRRTLPHLLFGRDDVATYLANVERALDDTVVELGDAGQVDVFELTRRLGHRVGLASWGGPGSASGGRFDRLARAFDTLDGSESFVHPEAMASGGGQPGSRPSTQALAVVTDELREEPGRAARPRDRTTRSSPGWRRPGPTSRRRAAGWGWPSTWPWSTSPPCPTCSPPSAGISSTSWPIPRRPSGSGPGTPPWPKPVPSNPSGWPSARSWPATCWSR